MKQGKKFFSSSLEGLFKEGGLSNWSHNNTAGSFISNEEFSPFWLGQRLNTSKVYLFKILLSLIFLLFIIRLIQLQIYQGGYFRAVAEGNRIKEEYLLPRRGIIFDRFEKPLVNNQGSFSLILNHLPRNYNPNELAAEYQLIRPYLEYYQSTAVKIDYWQEMVKRAASEPQVLIEELEFNHALALKLFLNSGVVNVVAESRRHYGGEGAWSHVVGYLSRIKPADKDYYLKNNYQLTERVGSDGLEAFYESDLHGQLGIRQLEVNSLGRVIDELSFKPEQPGANLYTTLDAELSKFIVKTLRARVPRGQGAVIALEPQSGQVLALVSWPSYDYNVFHH